MGVRRCSEAAVVKPHQRYLDRSKELARWEYEAAAQDRSGVQRLSAASAFEKWMSVTFGIDIK